MFLSKICRERCDASNELKQDMLKLMESGLVVELPVKKNITRCKKINIHFIGAYDDMDDVLNNWE